MAKPQKVMIMPHVRVVHNLRILPQQFPKSSRADSDLHVYEKIGFLCWEVFYTKF